MEPLTHLKYRTDNPEWNESYYFVFYDKKNTIGGMTRLGFKPNKQEGMTFFFLFLPNGSVAGYYKDQKIVDYTESLNVGGVWHKNQNQSHWNYIFQGNMIVVKNPEDLPKVRKDPKLIMGTQKVSIDISFESINEPYEYSQHMNPESLEIGKKAGDKHWEQIATLSGNIQLDDEKYLIKNAIGQRDHTYGVRDWTGVGNWLYYVVWFNNELAINPAVIITEDGQLSTGGFIFKNDQNIPLKSIQIVDQKFREDGVLPISSKLNILDALGKKYTLKAKIGSIIPVPFVDNEGNQSILVQSLGSFELNGMKGGYGSFETLRRLKT